MELQISTCTSRQDDVIPQFVSYFPLTTFLLLLLSLKRREKGITAVENAEEDSNKRYVPNDELDQRAGDSSNYDGTMMFCLSFR